MIKNGFNIKTVEDKKITDRKVLLRVDFNVTLTGKLTIANDLRIKQSLPTIKYLLKNKNKLILISHLGRPKRREAKYSLKIVAQHLEKLLSKYKVELIDDFLSVEGEKKIKDQKEKQVLMLENIRFYKAERKNDDNFANSLASLGDVYVNDAFGICHRSDTSIVDLPKLLPSYAGLLLKKEIEIISGVIKKPKKPFVAIIGGAKIGSKIGLLSKMVDLADYLLIGGALANTFLLAQGYKIGKSLAEPRQAISAREVIILAGQKKTNILLPQDVIVGSPDSLESGGKVVKIENVPSNLHILDMGPETQAEFGAIIGKAKTIVWNGPVGYCEAEQFCRGTDFLYYAITQNNQAVSIVGGGDTIAAISKEEYLDRITHISTGGGAMLEFIEKGTLPGIEALK